MSIESSNDFNKNMTRYITQHTLAFFISGAILFSIAASVFAYDDLEIVADVEDNVAEVFVYYEEDGENIEKEYTYDVVDYDELVDKIADQLNTGRGTVENALEYTVDESFEKGAAQDTLEDAEELLDAADAALDHARENDLDETLVDKASSQYTDAKKALEDANDQYAVEDWEDAHEYAEEAEELLEDIFDILGYDEDDFNDKTESERKTDADDAIDDAKEALKSAEEDIDEAKSDHLDTLEAKRLLFDAEELFDKVDDEYDDADYISAKRYAHEVVSLADDIEDTLKAEREAEEEKEAEEKKQEEAELQQDQAAEKYELQRQLIALLQQLIALLSMQ